MDNTKSKIAKRGERITPVPSAFLPLASNPKIAPTYARNQRERETGVIPSITVSHAMKRGATRPMKNPPKNSQAQPKDTELDQNAILRQHTNNKKK